MDPKDGVDVAEASSMTSTVSEVTKAGAAEAFFTTLPVPEHDKTDPAEGSSMASAVPELTKADDAAEGCSMASAVPELAKADGAEGCSMNSAISELDKVHTRLQIFTVSFLKNCEQKLQQYRQEYCGLYEKTGARTKLFKDTVTVAGAVTAAVLPSVSQAAASGVVSVSRAIGQVADEKLKRSKLKKLFWLMFLQENYQVAFESVLYHVACDIFQSFECQLMNYTTDNGPILAIDKITEDMVSRAINYFSDESIDEDKAIEQESLQDYFLKGIILGSSKAYGTFKTSKGHTVMYIPEDKSKPIKINTSEIFETSCLVEIDEGKHKYQHSLSEEKKCHGCRRSLVLLKGDPIFTSVDERSVETCKNSLFSSYTYVMSLRTPEQIKLKVKEMQQKVEVNNPQKYYATLVLKLVELNKAHVTRKELQDICDSIQGKIVKNQELLKEYEEKMRKHENYIKRLESSVKELSKQPERMLWTVEESSKNFTDRIKEMTHLHELLRSQKNHLVVVHGLAGMGKTELVKEYATQYVSEYSHSLYIDAATVESLTVSFQKIAKMLRINCNEDIDIVVGEIYDRLSTEQSLLIFDNAEDKAINHFLPKLRPDMKKNIHTILINSSKSLVQKNESLGVDIFPVNDAVTFLKKSSERLAEASEDLLKELAQKLSCIPLALEQAVNCIDNDACYSAANIDCLVQDYLKLLTEEPDKVLLVDDEGIDKTLSSSFNVTFKKLKANDSKYGDLAFKVLKIIAYFDSEDIPVRIFLKLKEVKNERDLQKICQLLEKYSLVKGWKDSTEKKFNVLKVLQTLIRTEYSEETEENTTEAINILNICMKENLEHSSSGMPGYTGFCHSLEVWKFVPHHVKSRFTDFVSRIICVSVACKRYEVAKSLTEELIGITVKEHGPVSIQTLKLVVLKSRLEVLSLSGDNSTQCGKYLREYEIALRDYETALRSSEESSDNGEYCQKEILIAYSEQAEMLHNIGKIEDSINVYQSVLQKLGETKYSLRDVLMIRYKLALALHENFEFSKAEIEYESVLKQQTAEFGDDDNDTLSTRYQLALLLSDTHRKEEAIKELTSVLDLRQQKLGCHHPATVLTTTAIVDVINEKSVFKLNRELLLRKKVSLNSEGIPSDEKTCKFVKKLCDRNEYDEALQALEEQLQRLKELGSTNPIVLQKQSMIIDVLEKKGELSLAIEKCQQLYELQESTHFDIPRFDFKLAKLKAKQK